MTTTKCSCFNEYQDRVYGQGVRLATTDKNGDVRCTSCGFGKTGPNPRRRKNCGYKTYKARV